MGLILEKVAENKPGYFTSRRLSGHCAPVLTVLKKSFCFFSTLRSFQYEYFLQNIIKDNVYRAREPKFFLFKSELK